MIEGTALALFRRCIGDCPAHGRILGEGRSPRRLREFSDAEIDQFDGGILVRDHDIPGVDIAMDDSASMHLGQGYANFAGDVNNLWQFEASPEIDLMP